MSLDSSLPIFHLRPSTSHTGEEDLVNATGKRIYTRRMEAGEGYGFEVEDSLYGAHFSSVSSPSAQSKTKTIALHNPDYAVDLVLSGRLTYSWRFAWEDETYEWRQAKMSKEWTLWMIREPDPNVDVARARSADSKTAPYVALQSYNLQRFETKDPKGLEVVILSSFLTFIDAERDRTASSFSSDRPALLAKTSSSSGTSPPPVPPKPNIREELGYGDFEDPPDPNEIIVKSSQSIDFYADKAFKLLNDPAYLFIIIRAKSVDTVQKAVLVAEATKRLRHLRWQEVKEDEEIHQYVVEEKNLPSARAPSSPTPLESAPSNRKPPKRINLNDQLAPILAKSPPSPPPPPPNLPHHHPWDSDPIASLSIYLSKIILPDLVPKVKRGLTSASTSPRNSLGPSSPSLAGSGRASPAIASNPPPPVEEHRFGRLMDGLGRLGLGGSSSNGGGGGLRIGSASGSSAGRG